MTKKLTTKRYWENVWQGIKLPYITRPEPDFERQLKSYLPVSCENRLIEIGCAPGGYMAYFHRTFGYSVEGIDYADKAVLATRENMRLLDIDAEVLNLDFLEADLEPRGYDVVFSGGFIEHFDDTDSIVARLCRLSKNYVVTVVPNLLGLNGLISRSIRPEVFKGHQKITKKQLRSLHEQQGLDTLFCEYVGGPAFIMPAAKTDFFNKWKTLARVLNLPFRVFNRISDSFAKYTGICLRTRLLSLRLLYIGRRTDLNNDVSGPNAALRGCKEY